MYSLKMCGILGKKQTNKNLKIDICKIDVQGEDYKVLLGMKQNLKKGNIKILKIA